MASRFVGLAMAAVFALPLLAADTLAVTIVDGFALEPNVRTRFVRFDGRDGNDSNGAVEYFENRVRLGVDLDMLEYVRFYIAVQDVRVWGEELSTAGDYTANGFDLNAGFAEVRLGDTNLTLRFGRQAIVFDSERFIGALEWAPQGRRFDAIRLQQRYDELGLEWDLFYSMLFDEESIFPGPATNQNDRTEHLGGFRLGHDVKFEGLGGLDSSLVVFYEDVEDSAFWRLTVGGSHAGALDVFRYRVEGWVQAGDSTDGDILAYMFGVEAGVHLKRAANLRIMAWLDYLSGASDPAEGARRTFDPRFGTNHKFYGFADFFLNLPVHTQGKGLIDAALKVSIKPVPQWSIAVHGHYMLTAEDQGGPSDWGTEIDVLTTWKPVKYFSVQLGVFTMLPGKALELRLGGNDPDIGVYTTVGASY